MDYECGREDTPEELGILEYSRESMQMQEDSLIRLRLLVSRASAMELGKSFKAQGTSRTLTRSLSINYSRRSSLSDCSALSRCGSTEEPRLTILGSSISNMLDKDCNNSEEEVDLSNQTPTPQQYLEVSSQASDPQFLEGLSHSPQLVEISNQKRPSIPLSENSHHEPFFTPLIAAGQLSGPIPSTPTTGRTRRSASVTHFHFPKSLQRILSIKGPRTWGHATDPRRHAKAPGALLNLHLVTFNMGGQMPDPIEMHEWLPCNCNFDMIVIGLQECVFGRTSSMGEEAIRNFFAQTDEDAQSDDGCDATNTKFSAFSRKSARLESMIKQHVGSDYFDVRTTTSGGMMLMVLAHVKHKDNVRHVKTTIKPTGIGGLIANKGGIVCRTRVFGAELCFVSCHLAAHEAEDKVVRRNQDMQEVFKAASLASRLPLDVSQRYPHTFVMGDLNYRVNLAIADGVEREDRSEHVAAVHSLIKASDFDALVKADQLGREQREGNVLQGFTETNPSFEPSYKLRRDPGLTYVAERMPSYTDRILWTSLPAFEGNIHQTVYDSCPLVSTSDHKPVYANFTLSPHVVTDGEEEKEKRENNGDKEDDQGQCQLVLSVVKLRGVSREMEPLFSNCILKFSSAAMTTDKVGIINASGNEYGEFDLHSPPLPLRVPHSQLKSHHLFITMWSHTNELLGQGVMGLASVAGSCEETAFSFAVLRYGRGVGTATGHISGQVAAPAKPVAAKQHTSHLPHFPHLLNRHLKQHFIRSSK